MSQRPTSLHRAVNKSCFSGRKRINSNFNQPPLSGPGDTVTVDSSPLTCT